MLLMFPEIQFKNVTKLLYTRNHITFQDQSYEMTGFRTQLTVKRCLTEPTVKVETTEDRQKRFTFRMALAFISLIMSFFRFSITFWGDICMCCISNTSKEAHSIIVHGSSSAYLNVYLQVILSQTQLGSESPCMDESLNVLISLTTSADYVIDNI